MNVIFTTNDGQQFKEQIWFFSTVLEIKEKLQKNHDFPISRQTLFINDQMMEDERDIECYNIIEGAHIFLRLDPEKELKSDPSKPTNGNVEKIKVTVLMPMEGREMSRVEVEVNLSDNVSELRKELLRMKERIHDFQLPEDGFFFIYKQRGMNENKTFRWYEVKSEDVIEIFNGGVMGG